MGRKRRAVHVQKAGPVAARLNGAKERTDRLKYLFVVGALWVAALAAYSNSFHGGFVFDNRSLILGDPRVFEATPKNFELIFQHSYWWPKGETRLYRPLTTLSFLFNYSVLGNRDQPSGYHWFNFVLHALNIFLVFALSLRFLKKLWPSAFVAGMWAVHPVLTESVTNIIGRSDLLAAASLMSGFLFYLKSTESSGWTRFGWLTALSIATLIGAFSKESAVTILGLVLLFELTWWKERRQLRGLVLGCAAIVPALLVLFYQRSVVFASSATSEAGFLDNPLAGAPFITARLTAIAAMAKYLWLLVWPARLSCDYSYASISLATGSAWDWICWITVATVIGLAAWQFSRNRVVFFFSAWAFITFLPTSNLLLTIGTIMADRFLYLPAMAFSMCVVVGIYFAAERSVNRRAAPVLLSLIIVALGIRTWRRNLHWENDVRLWTSAVQTVPQSFKGHAALAAALFELDPTHSNLARVIEEADQSVAILNKVPDALNSEVVYADAGLYYMTKGDLLARPGPDATQSQASLDAYTRAQELLKRSVAIDQASYAEFKKKEQAIGKTDAEIPRPGFARLYANLAENSLRVGDDKTAYESAKFARFLDPQNLNNYLILSKELAAESRKEEAAVALVEGVIMSGGAAPELLAKLRELYGTGLDPKGCAILKNARGEFLNNACEPAHNELCSASAELVAIYRQRLRSNMADQTKQYALQLGCPTEMLSD